MTTMPQGDLILVQTSFARQNQAREMARKLVEQGLAACAQVTGPVLSTYEWKGKLQYEKEYVLNVKTTSSRYSELAGFIDRNHPYELPEIVATPVARTSGAYLDWVKQQCRK